MWISTECGAFSPIQNFNQRTEQQRKDLQDKQREARKQRIGGLLTTLVRSAAMCIGNGVVGVEPGSGNMLIGFERT